MDISFWDSGETITEKMGSDYEWFKLFGPFHLAELAVVILAIVFITYKFHKADEKGRKKIW
jgi:hypothetical protein